MPLVSMLSNLQDSISTPKIRALKKQIPRNMRMAWNKWYSLSLYKLSVKSTLDNSMHENIPIELAKTCKIEVIGKEKYMAGKKLKTVKREARNKTLCNDE